MKLTKTAPLAATAAPSFYNVSNRHTFSFIFGRDLASPDIRAARRSAVIDMVLRYVRAA
ncbi:hypothetical protein [Massilia putida]|uniref:hypothetical protein n=1 Tax=Massilia putida TaxID=1141883 RepID=UPI0012EC8610|nr:hypothetical protein [Massilia putida]